MDRFANRGFSLVELMVGLAIGLVLLSGLAYLIVNQTNARNELDKSMRQFENGRYAMELLADDLRLAGYYGEASSFGNAPSALPDPCDTSVAGLTQGLALPVVGYSQPNPSPLSCLPTSEFVQGTDILVVRRAESEDSMYAVQPNFTSSTDGLTAGEVYIQTNGAYFALNVATGTSSTDQPNFSLLQKDGVTPAKALPYYVRIYYVSPCHVPAGGNVFCTGSADDHGHPIPTLKRLELTVGPGLTVTQAYPPVALVEGVEMLHLEYGVDSDGDGSPDGSYQTNPGSGSPANWANVMTVRIGLVARNTQPSTGYTDSKTYNLGTFMQAYPVPAGAKNYKRHAYVEIVRIINPSSRREQ